jgi:hypothetical protein
VEISDQMWVQASLPVAMGGLGIRGTQDLAIPAYLASIASTSDLVSHSCLPQHTKPRTRRSTLILVRDQRRSSRTALQPPTGVGSPHFGEDIHIPHRKR